jgi:hypothetical protein
MRSSAAASPAFERDVDDRPIAFGHAQVADDAGAAAVGNDDGADAPRFFERGRRFVVRRRKRDAIGAAPDAPAAHRDPVGRALAEGVIESRRGIGLKSVDAGKRLAPTARSAASRVALCAGVGGADAPE